MFSRLISTTTVARPSVISRFYAQRVVSFHYSLTNKQGQPIESSRLPGRTPLAFLEGTQAIIPKLEREV
jgi:FKBP-type peptidyl-prolyl cis-trans isomerase 2